jgi:hypothetical protein
MGGSDQSSIQLLVFCVIHTIFCRTEARKVDMMLLPSMFRPAMKSPRCDDRCMNKCLVPCWPELLALVLFPSIPSDRTPRLHEEFGDDDDDDDDDDTIEVSPTSVTLSPNLRNFKDPPLLPELTTNASTASRSCLKRRPSKPNDEICSSRENVVATTTSVGSVIVPENGDACFGMDGKLSTDYVNSFQAKLDNTIQRTNFRNASERGKQAIVQKIVQDWCHARSRLRRRRIFWMTTDADSWQVLSEIAAINAVSAIFSCRLYPSPLQS